ncbi:MAG: hypothetical protein ACLTYN_09980 [Dysosmobacter welbionis]
MGERGQKEINPSAGADALIDPQPRCPVTAGERQRGEPSTNPTH